MDPSLAALAAVAFFGLKSLDIFFRDCNLVFSDFVSFECHLVRLYLIKIITMMDLEMLNNIVTTSYLFTRDCWALNIISQFLCWLQIDQAR